MVDFLKWYLVISVLGWLTFPITFRFSPNLKDRGFAFSRAFGLLLWGYAFWLLGSFHVLQNDLAGQTVALAVLCGASIYFAKQNWAGIKTWFKQNVTLILVIEAVFLVLFAGWTLVRAANPVVAGTEKPMEMAFINAILRSPSFPPNDPWLSGYAISYYYFGYVIIAMLARVTGVASGVAFNLAAASWFALTGLGAYGLIHTLISAWQPATGRKTATNFLWALLGPFYLLIVSNAEGVFEYLHARGIFWTRLSDVSFQSNFWRWLDLQELTNPPALPLSWIPQRAGGILWWRASRVLSDYDLTRNWKEIIDEFPFFSYILADLHPHVLTMPFVLLILAIGFNFFLSSWASENRGFAWKGWLRKPDFWILALAAGSLAFFNTWDFPIYVALICCAYMLLQVRKNGWQKRIWIDFVGFGLLLGLTGIVMFLPFYTGFKSQAGGIIPSLEYFTRGVHFWIMFAPLLVPILAFLIWLFLQSKNRTHWRKAAWISGVTVFGLWVLSYLLGGFMGVVPALGNLVGGAIGEKLSYLGNNFFNLHGSANLGSILGESLKLRFLAPGTWLTLFGVLFLLIDLFLAIKPGKNAETVDPQNPVDHGAVLFALLLVLTGAALTLVPEFFYLIDQFGWRMNTIFKFYFETWIVWSIAAAFGSVILWKSIRNKAGRVVFGIAWFVSLAAGLAYPSFALPNTTNNFHPDHLNLNGLDYFSYSKSGEAAAIDWLKTAPYGTIVEAVGGSYSEFERVSEQTGLPTVLGWPGHESQWRGGALEMGSRESDIQTLYRTTSWQEAKEILRRFGIKYIFIGSLERSSIRVSEEKFATNLPAVFQNDSVTIYLVPDSIFDKTTNQGS
jgi:YYY domain-containing protein